MAAEIPIVEPTSFYAGDTVKWKITLTDYSASDGWTLKYSLLNSSGVILVSSTASSADHLVTITASVSGAYKPGKYNWQSYVDNGDDSTAEGYERYSINSGQIEVKPNQVRTHGLDVRSDVQQIFEALEATILGRASQAQLSRRVGDRQIQYMSADELIKWRNFYKNEYEKETGNGGKRQQIKVRFTAE